MYRSLLKITFAIFTAAAATAVHAVNFPLPDTGQTQCYDNFAEIPCPSPGEPFYGQDAQYQGIQPAYQDNGDGTVTSQVTDLLWQQTDRTGQPWQRAIDSCEYLTLGGHTDWRLPEIYELETLVDYSIAHPGPTIDTSYFPETVPHKYWSSTTHAHSEYRAWYIYFYDGSDYGGFDYHDSKSIYRDFRCVRSGQVRSFSHAGISLSSAMPERGTAAHAFVDEGDGTVSDVDTGLMWQQQDDNTVCTWQEALAYCENSILNGYEDWRLPNVRELKSIVDHRQYSPSIDTSYFPKTVSSYYWSSTTYAGNTEYAWNVYFEYGLASYGNKLDSRYVRCVRSGQGGPFDYSTLSLVYRFQNTHTSTHFYTMDESEKNTILSDYPWFVYEGGAWKTYHIDDHPDESLPIYRFYNTDTGAHFFTMNESEKNDIINNYSWFRYEGIAFYAYAPDGSAPDDALPVYRFYNNSTGGHFFTINEAEKDTIVLNYPWFRYEGVAWYAFAPEDAAQ